MLARVSTRRRGLSHPASESTGLLQGPLQPDDQQGISTHFAPVWREDYALMVRRLVARKTRDPGEAAARHLDRVMQAIGEAVIAGGTHLLVPRKAAGWLAEHPLLADYLAAC